jgi:hypothetical protein
MPDLQNIISNTQGELIAKIARDRASKLGGLYAKNQTPISPYANLTSNKEPEKSLLYWLRGVNKCNQFVGDVLTKAGIKMPTFVMKDGTEHYVNAERLPKQNKYFDKICKLSELRAGDIVVIDDLKRKGESGAHVELVSFVDYAKKIMSLIGARKDGAQERESMMLNELSDESAIKCGFTRHKKNQEIYFLRPKPAIY